MQHRLSIIARIIFVICFISQYVTAFSSSSSSFTQTPILPSNPSDLIKQASAAISKAYLEDEINLQTIRLPLTEAMYSDKEEGFVADRAIGWQGGPQETIRYLSPLVQNILKSIKMTNNNMGGLPVKVSEQILLDFDGSTLQTSEHPTGPLYDIQAILQPNTDGYYLKTIQQIEEQFSNTKGKEKRLFLLVNPAWRGKQSFGIFGGKKAQEQILDRYSTTYAVDQFIVRGRKVSLLKCWSQDWAMFIGNEDDTSSSEMVATFKHRPEYTEIDKIVIARM